MAFRATNLVKSMMTMMRPRGTTTTFATWSTSPKMKAYSPAAADDHHHDYTHQYPKPKPAAVKGAYAPVYISLGLIMMSVSIGVFTATHQLRHSPNVYVKKSKRETVPELVDPDEVAQESDAFIKKSFFRKIAHVQDADRQEIMPDPIRGDTYAM
uniref:uncharacterized protein LOC122588326 n=1 Tax=Erigeron canadensis TaxID=72917 RepID=UPI001CB9C102|nr:uncharacterized protein LOC122588326 [Erigeron canadensis]